MSLKKKKGEDPLLELTKIITAANASRVRKVHIFKKSSASTRTCKPLSSEQPFLVLYDHPQEIMGKNSDWGTPIRQREGSQK